MKKILLAICLLLSTITYSQNDYNFHSDNDYYGSLVTKELIIKYFENKGVQVYYEKDKSLICTHHFYNEYLNK